MPTTLTTIFSYVVLTATVTPGLTRKKCEQWIPIRTLVEKYGSEEAPEVVEHLKGLSPAEMLIAARQGCEEASSDTRVPVGQARVRTGVSNALMCLEYALDTSDAEDVAALILDRAADPHEHPWLRLAIVGSTHGYSRHRFPQRLRAYTLKHWVKVYELIVHMLQSENKDVFLRAQLVESLAEVLRDQIWRGCATDPNIRAALGTRKEDGREIVQIVQLVQSGDVKLAPATLQSLDPVMVKVDESIKLLGVIANDQEHEAQLVRDRAKHTLERFRMLRSLQLEERITKVLKEDGK